MTNSYLQFNARQVQQLVNEKLAKQDRIVVERRMKNVDVVGVRPDPLERETFWYALMMCLLTSQQKSSYDDPVPTFLRKEPFPLSYSECYKAYRRGELAEFTRTTLQENGGIRFAIERIPSAVEANFNLLEMDQGIRWKRLINRGRALMKQRNLIPVPLHYEIENEAAEYVDQRFKGFGCKQSRNFWQSLGLTRYVPVIDTRIKKWCVENLKGDWSKYVPTNRQDYMRMADAIVEVCLEADVLPCMFDAAAFSTGESNPDAIRLCRGDDGDWDDDEVRD